MFETFESSILHSWMKMVDRYFFAVSKMRGSIYAFVLAFVLMLLALLMHLAMTPLDAGYQYLTFFLMVVLSAVFGGFWPGLFATIVGIVFAATILKSPQFYSLSIDLFKTSIWPNVVFFVDGAIVSISIEIMHQYRQGFNRGLSQTINATTALAQTESKYRHLMNSSTDGIHIMDVDGNLLEANDAFCHMLGYTQDEVTRLKVTDWDAKFSEEELRSMFSNGVGKSMLFETVHRGKDGSLRDVEISVSNALLGEGSVFYASSRDVYERRRMENELLQTTQKLRELAAIHEASQEAERKAIAREVHDELGQILSTLRLNISMMRTRFGKHHTELMALVQSMNELVDRAIHGVRNVSENLRPAVLEIGVFVSIKWLADNFEEHSGIPCVLESPDPCVELNEACAVVIFRIVQESLTNVMRHAQANSVKIALSAKDGSLCVEVKDDGIGFDMNISRQKTAYGQFGMFERARACGGDLDIVSAPGKGTLVSVRIPIISGAGKR